MATNSTGSTEARGAHAKRKPRHPIHKGRHYPIANRMLQRSLTAIEGVCLGLEKLDVAALDPLKFGEWAASLEESLSQLTKLRGHLTNGTGSKPRRDADGAHRRHVINRRSATYHMLELRRAHRAWRAGNDAGLFDALVHRPVAAPGALLASYAAEHTCPSVDCSEKTHRRAARSSAHNFLLVPKWALLAALRAVMRDSFPGLDWRWEREPGRGRQGNFLARWRDDMEDWHRYRVVSACRKALGLGWRSLPRGETVYSWASTILAGTPAAIEESSLEKACRRVAARLRSEPQRYYQARSICPHNMTHPGGGDFGGMPRDFWKRLAEIEEFTRRDGTNQAGTKAAPFNPPPIKAVSFK